MCCHGALVAALSPLPLIWLSLRILLSRSRLPQALVQSLSQHFMPSCPHTLCTYIYGSHDEAGVQPLCHHGATGRRQLQEKALSAAFCVPQSIALAYFIDATAPGTEQCTRRFVMSSSRCAQHRCDMHLLHTTMAHARTWSDFAHGHLHTLTARRVG